MFRFAGAERRPAIAAAAAALALLAVVATAEDGREPPPRGVVRPLAPRTNRTTKAKVELGAKLFTDRRLSVDGASACATCHVASLAFTDGRAVPTGRGGKKLARNAPTLLNVGLVRDLFHDGRAPSLEEQARAVLLHPDELGWPDAGAFAEHMAGIEEYTPLFEEAFGDPAVTMQRTVRALAAFERTLLSGDAPFDAWWAGDEAAMSDAAARGYRLFIADAGCVQCHSIRQSYALFSDGRFHNTGAGKDEGKADPGRAKITGEADDTGAFRTPTLRNIELTGPFMHDGSLAILEEVIDFYVDGGGRNPHLSALMRPLALDEEDRADLLAFLKALTSPVLPPLEDCDKLLAEGRPRDALAAFEAELVRNPNSDRAADGAARSALELDERGPLLRAEHALRARVRVTSPGGANDGEPEVAAHLLLLARVSAALTNKEEALAVARAEDAILVYRRVRRAEGAAWPVRDEALLGEALWLRVRGRRGEAIDLLTARAAAETAPRSVREALGTHRYRRGFRGYAGDGATDADTADMRAAGELLDTLEAEQPLYGVAVLLRAYAWHYAGETEKARTAYIDALGDDSAAERALAGLRNLMSPDIAGYRALLEELLAKRPRDSALLYFVGCERLGAGDVARAEQALRKRIDVEPFETAWPRVYLARALLLQKRRDDAMDAYFDALRVRPGLAAVVAEVEGAIRARRLDGFAAVDAMIADYDRFLAVRPDDARFQVLSRNNLAFTLREVVSSFTSRGPARIQTFPDGTPERARALLKKCVALYAEAIARIPEDVDDLPFAERWVYAGVFNDTGLMHHYFAAEQDFERAEEMYLRAFDLTGGAYQDAYFYNLQFLYAFELPGREAQWLELAEVAKDALLREDPSSETGFSPDEIKRRAALRDWERLSATLGR